MAANTTLQLRFVQLVDNAYQYSGIYIDDFATTANLATNVDVVAPVVTINTAIPSGTVQTIRTVSNVVNVTDATPSSGVNVTAGSSPRLYYKKSGDVNSSAGWKYVESASTASPFAFSINYAQLNAGSVSVGDVINYFVVAADNAGKTGVQSGVTCGGTVTTINLTPTNLSGVTGFSSFTITTGPLNLTNTIVSHPLSTANIGSNNNQLLGIQLQVGGSTGTLALTSLNLAGVETSHTFVSQSGAVVARRAQEIASSSTKN
jgi:hypothetical protein